MKLSRRSFLSAASALAFRALAPIPLLPSQELEPVIEIADKVYEPISAQKDFSVSKTFYDSLLVELPVELPIVGIGTIEKAQYGK